MLLSSEQPISKRDCGYLLGNLICAIIRVIACGFSSKEVTHFFLERPTENFSIRELVWDILARIRDLC